MNAVGVSLDDIRGKVRSITYRAVKPKKSCWPSAGSQNKPEAGWVVPSRQRRLKLDRLGEDRGVAGLGS